MKAHILSPNDWSRLEERMGLPALLPYCKPEDTDVVVVEDETGKIVAVVCALLATHFEGLWIEPAHRGNAGTFRALINRVYEIPRARGEHWVFGGAADSKMDSLCCRLGGKPLDMKLYALPVPEGE